MPHSGPSKRVRVFCSRIFGSEANPLLVTGAKREVRSSEFGRTDDIAPQRVTDYTVSPR